MIPAPRKQQKQQQQKKQKSAKSTKSAAAATPLLLSVEIETVAAPAPAPAPAAPAAVVQDGTQSVSIDVKKNHRFGSASAGGGSLAVRRNRRKPVAVILSKLAKGARQTSPFVKQTASRRMIRISMRNAATALAQIDPNMRSQRFQLAHSAARLIQSVVEKNVVHFLRSAYVVTLNDERTRLTLNDCQLAARIVQGMTQGGPLLVPSAAKYAAAIAVV